LDKVFSHWSAKLYYKREDFDTKEESKKAVRRRRRSRKQ
jgi:hypothetical protein